MSDKNILSQAVPAVRHPDYKHEIAALLRGNLAPRQLQKQLEDYHEHDIAEALELLRRDERCRLYALLDAPTLAGVLEYTEGTCRSIWRNWVSGKSWRSFHCWSHPPRWII